MNKTSNALRSSCENLLYKGCTETVPNTMKHNRSKKVHTMQKVRLLSVNSTRASMFFEHT